MATEFDPDEVVRQVTETLADKFPKYDPADIEKRVRAAVDDLKDRPITDYIAVLAQRAVKKNLKK